MKKTYRDLKILMMRLGFNSINGKKNLFETKNKPKTVKYKEGIMWTENCFKSFPDGDCIIGWL